MDEKTRPDVVKPRTKPLSPREQKLADALRANLRRRKAPPAAKGDSSNAGRDP